MTDFRKFMVGENVRRMPWWVCMFQFAAALGVLGGIVTCSCWRLLACPLVMIPFCLICDLAKRIYWRGFDPFIWRASDQGRFRAMLFWNVLTVVLDWLIPVLSTILCLGWLESLVPGHDVPVTLRLFLLWCCVFPFRPLIRKNLRLFVDPGVILQGGAVFACAVVSLWIPVKSVHVVLTLVGMACAFCPIAILVTMPEFRRTYERLLKETREGKIHDYRRLSGWFPRPGVLFEPDLRKFAYLGPEVMGILPSLTVVRINVFGFVLSFLSLSGGAVGMVCLGRGTMLLLLPVLILLGLFYGSVVCEIDRKPSGFELTMRGVFTFCSMCCISLPMLYFGGTDLTRLLVSGGFCAASWFFCAGFVVRGSSWGVFDTLEYLLTLAALTGIAFVRAGGCTWYDSLVPALFFAFLLPRLRKSFPRTDLPKVPDEPTPVLPRNDQMPRQDRRLRKRERQLAALRRSQWRREK